MTNAPIARSQLTKYLFEHLADVTLLGRGVAPPDGGWSDGQPGVGTFANYAVLKTGRAITPAPGEPERTGRFRTSWRVSYQVTYHSVNESNVDELADMGRARIVTFDGPFTLDGIDWTLQSIQIPQLGATERDD